MERVVSSSAIKIGDPYAYLDKCDVCEEKSWVRLFNDGDSQCCWRCDGK
jgi:hypothetical protein